MHLSPPPARQPVPPVGQRRGVYRSAGMTPETVVYVLVDRAGQPIGRIELVARLATPLTDGRLRGYLDLVDPQPRLMVSDGGAS